MLAHNKSWRATLPLLASALMALAACSGNYTVRQPIDRAQYKMVYIEKFDGDQFQIKSRLEFKFVELGFESVSEKGKADVVLIWRYTHAAFGTNATVRLVDRSGKTVYLGEGDNPGFGTLLNKTGATWGCFERALAGLEKI